MLLRVLALLVLAFALPAAAASVTVSDVTEFRKGPFFIYPSPWGRPGLAQGRDYADVIQTDTSSFPNGTRFEWRWPNTQAPRGVYGYDYIGYGGYYGSASATETPVTARQVKAIHQLTVASGFGVSGETDNFNVVIDFFLTAHPHGVPDGAERLWEIEVLLHPSKVSRTWAAKQVTVGRFGRWRVTRAGNDFLFMPSGDLLQSNLDLTAMLQWLVARKQISGAEWFSGLGLGAEPVQGVGGLTIGSISVAYR